MEKSEILEKLSKNSLFQGLSKSRIDELLSLCSYSVVSYGKESMLSSEDEPCQSIGFVLDGKASALKSNPSGNHVVVRSMECGDFFGEAMVFSSSHLCPSTIMTSKDSEILYISADDILKLCEIDHVFLRTFLASLSDKIFMLNKKIKMLSYSSVRQRLSCFLLEEMNLNDSKNFMLSKTREELGALLGIARPSISRELSSMVSDGLISIKGKQVAILNPDAMKALL